MLPTGGSNVKWIYSLDIGQTHWNHDLKKVSPNATKKHHFNIPVMGSFCQTGPVYPRARSCDRIEINKRGKWIFNGAMRNGDSTGRGSSKSGWLHTEFFIKITRRPSNFKISYLFLGSLKRLKLQDIPLDEVYLVCLFDT